MSTPATLSLRMSCPGCAAAIDLTGRKIGDSARCPGCGKLQVVLRSRAQGDVPPAVVTGGLSAEERGEVRDALRRIKLRRVGQGRAHVELYPSWAIFTAGVQFYLAAILAGQNLIALGEPARGRRLQVAGVLAYALLGAGLLFAARTLDLEAVPQVARLAVLAVVPLVFAVVCTQAQHAPAQAAREHGARQASLLLPGLVGLILAIAQAFAVYFLWLRLDG